MSAGDRSNWPILVRIGLIGYPSRASARLFFLNSLGLGIVFVVASLWFWPYIIGGIFFVSVALWFHLTIRWVDSHSVWN
jgi:hypothetical protein